MNLDLDDDEQAVLMHLLRAVLAADRFPLSPRVRCLKGILAKLDPAKPPVVEPYPPPKAWVNSTIGQRKRRR
jgi:hypothetical protein